MEVVGSASPGPFDDRRGGLFVTREIIGSRNYCVWHTGQKYILLVHSSVGYWLTGPYSGTILLPVRIAIITPTIITIIYRSCTNSAEHHVSSYYIGVYFIMSLQSPVQTRQSFSAAHSYSTRRE